MKIAATLERFGRLADVPWTSNPRVGLRLIVASCVATILVAALGPSTVTLNLGAAGGLLPPWYIPESVGKSWGLPLSEWIVVPVLWLGIVIGAIGLWVAWRAVRDGWRPNVRRLFLLGVGLNMATAFVPPVTSADVLMYAAYGRLQRQGINPYDISPAGIFRQAFDPVLVLTERPWQDTPSVYGPIASWSQLIANLLGGDSMHDVVFWLQMFCVIPFIAIGAIVVKLAHDDPAQQVRAVLFTILNPLLIWAVVAGAHNEALGLVFAIGGLWFVRRSPFVTGLCIGLAGCVKVSLIYYGIAMAWGYRRDWRKLLQLFAGAAIPLVVGCGIFAPQALFAATRNAGYISAGGWAAWLWAPLTWIVPDAVARQITNVVGWVLLFVVAWMLSRLIPWQPVYGAKVPARVDPLTITTRTALILCAAWLITSPYSLSWYDLIAWAPLALLGPNKLDKVLMWRGAALSVSYVTARGVNFTPEMLTTAFVIRDQVCSGLQWVVLGYIAWCWWQDGRKVPTLGYVRHGFTKLLFADRPPQRLR